MLKVLSDFDKVKQEMLPWQASIKENIRDTKKLIKKRMELRKKASMENAIDNLEAKAKMYTPSKVLPVRIEGVVVNYKLYASFMKKLKSFEVSMFVQDNRQLVIQYWKRGSLGQGKGMLVLYNIADYYKDFKHIPEAVLLDDETT